MFNGMYLADPLTAGSWCARGLALPHLDALPRQRDSLLDHLGQAKGSSSELAEAQQIAATLDPGTVLERVPLCCSRLGTRRSSLDGSQGARCPLR
jgi:hypothetical protein